MIAVKKPILLKITPIPRNTIIETLEGNEVAGERDYLCENEYGRHLISDTYSKTMYRHYKDDLYIKNPIYVNVTEMTDAFKVPSRFAQNGYLLGKAGDFLVESLSSEEEKWIIDRKTFYGTYEIIE